MSTSTNNYQTTRQVTKAELPISCPPSNEDNWSAHPRVFLPLSEQNPNETCPYCSAQFALVPSK